MFFGKNKTSLKLAKQHPELLMGCEYYIVENAINPKKIKVGSGLTQLFLKNNDGEEYLIEGNFSSIKELFTPTMTFESLNGKIVKVKHPIGSLSQNQLLKEIAPCKYDEKFQFGIGVTEQYFIQKDTNKVIKIYGNSKQIKNLFEDVSVSPKIQNGFLSNSSQKLVEQVSISEETDGQSIKIKGVKGDKGDRGEVGPRGLVGPAGPKGAKGDKGDQGPQGPKGEKGEKGEQGDRGLVGLRGAKGEKGDRGDVGPEGPQGPVGPQGKDGKNGKDGGRGPIGLPGQNGAPGPRGPEGIPGKDGRDGKDGISPVISANYPLILEDGTLSFDSEKFTKVLDHFKNTDIQNAINKLSTAIPTGGGAVGIKQEGERIIKSVSDINFTGSGVSVTRQGKNVTVDISGDIGPIVGGVAQIVAGTGITLDPPEGTGIVTISTTGGGGATGATGPQGLQGNTGATGPAGATGTQGNTGATGATGSQGPQGNTGATGAIPTDYVISFNGLTGAVNFAAGSGITLSVSGNTFTIASTSSGGGSPVYGITTSIDFSEQINQIKLRVGGTSSIFTNNLSIFNNYKITNIALTTTVEPNVVTFSNIVSYHAFYDTSLGLNGEWVVDIIAKPPFKLNTTAETLSTQTFASMSVSWEVDNLAITDDWTDGDGAVYYNPAEIIHKPETLVTKTLTGITWATASSFITCKVMGLTSADHTAEDAIIEGVQFEINNIVGGTGFDIIGHAPEGTYGKYTIECLGQ